MKRMLLGLGLLLLLPDGVARATSPVDALDRASACHRRGKTPCTLEHADEALSRLGEEAQPSLRREALRLRAEALARLDRAEEAEVACAELIRANAAWRPASDADPRVVACFDAAHNAQRKAQLPQHRDALERPLPEPTSPLPEPSLIPPPPTDKATLEPPIDWTFSLGGGLALPYPYTPTLFAPGPVVMLDLGYRVWGDLHLWSQVTMSLLNFDAAVLIEPGFGRSLTIASGVIGVAYSLPILSWLEARAAGGIGAGGFGVGDPDDRVGLALDLTLGARLKIDRHLAVRLDAAPTVNIPTDGSTMGGHISIVVRCEFRL
jgi:hypothetical protein